MKEEHPDHKQALAVDLLTTQVVVYEGHAEVNNTNNVFGEKITTHSHSTLETASIMADGGERVSYVFQGDPRSQYAMFSEVHEKRKPILIFVPEEYRGIFDLPGLSYVDAPSFLDTSVIARKWAEKYLCPVIIYYHNHTGSSYALETVKKEWVEFIGHPSYGIQTPEPWQIQVFGNKRRLVPEYLSGSAPQMVGFKRMESEQVKTELAKDRFSARNYDFEFQDVLADWKEASGRKHPVYYTTGGKKSHHAIICTAELYTTVKELVEKRSKETRGFDVLHINDPQTLGIGYLSADLKKYTSITLMGRDLALLNRMHNSLEKLHASALWVRCIADPTFQESDWKSIFKNGLDKNPSLLIHPTFSYQRNSSEHPRLETIDQRSRQLFPDAISGMDQNGTEVAVNPLFSGKPIELTQYYAPSFQREKLADFVESLRLSGNTEVRFVSPLDVSESIPAGASHAISKDLLHGKSPQIHASECTGCLQCMLGCPESAISIQSNTLVTFIESALKKWSNQGEEVTHFTPVVKNWVKMAGKHIVNKNTSISEALAASIDEYIALKKPAEDKESAWREVASKVIDILKWETLVASEALFMDNELYEEGTGEILRLQINPDLCTSCGVCVSDCHDGAIEMQTTETEPSHSTLPLQLLSSTRPETITHLLKQKDFDPFSVLLLMNPPTRILGPTVKDGPTEMRQSVLQFLTLVKMYTDTHLSRLKERTLQARDELFQQVKESMEADLPTSSFDSFIDILKEKPGLSVKELWKQSEPGNSHQEEYEDKLTLIQHLDEHVKQLEGVKGFYQIMIADCKQLEFLRTYPVNPFHVPVVTTKSAHALSGWKDQLFRKSLRLIKLLRKAEWHLKNQYKPAVHDSILQNLDWGQLLEEERNMIPMPVYISSHNHFLKDSTPQALPEEGLPVHCLLLSPYSTQMGLEWGNNSFSWLHYSEYYFFQGVLGNNRSLYTGIRKGFASGSPAIYSIATTHAPNQIQRKEWSEWLIKTRLWPVITSEIKKGERSIELSENDQFYDAWVSYEKGDAQWMPAQYLLTQDFGKDHFTAWQDDGETTEHTVTNPEDGKRYTPDSWVGSFTARIASHWKLLRSMAGYNKDNANHLSEQLAEQKEQEAEGEKKRVREELQVQFERDLQNEKTQLRKILRDNLVKLSMSKDKR